MSKRERARLDGLLKGVWVPLSGPQRTAYDSEADVLLYGGAAGGGKTDLLLGLALGAHRRSILFRREFAQLKAIEDRAREMTGPGAHYSATRHTWQLPGGRSLELGAVQRPGDERKYQGRPHDLKAFDEITHFTEAQFRFLIGWNRSAEPGRRCRVVAAGNPPTSAQGDWVIRYWAPWLDRQHPNPAEPGELRWFATIDGKEVEVESGAAFDHGGERIEPRSRSFIRARVEDNPFLIAAGYRATLQSLPEPLRSQMLFGDFAAKQADDPWQVIPTEWVLAAQARWQECPPGPLDTLGVDVARGGRDRTVVTARHGPWFAHPESFPGAETPDGQAVVALLVPLLAAQAAVQVDVIGVGAAVYDAARARGLHAVPLNGAAGSAARDRSGQLGFANARAEWWWRLREALDPSAGDGLALPPDRELLADLTAPRWRLASAGILVERKDEIIARIGRSPDKGDSLVYAHARPLVPGQGLLDFLREEIARG
ncbi:terminase family protein [Aliidongia dinghuensis]|uniref:terminase family protein n=1 Tax=Aliidongia dinghuensis TaxID=1867774 RepID=UPI001664A83D|nr:terminase family protein [Aliidongia dinghuensis]